MSGFGVIPKGGASVPGLKAKAKANPQLVVGGAAVAIVVAVALLSKKGTAAAGGIGADSATAAGGQLTPNQGGYYDSTANDVYQSLMGQFVTLQQQVASLSEGPSTPTPTPTPAPTPTPVDVPKPAANPNPVAPKTSPTAIYDHLTRNAATGAIYGVTKYGVSTHLTPTQFQQFGAPTVKALLSIKGATQRLKL